MSGEAEWAAALKKLSKIGFADTKKNIKLLRKKDGNLDKVIAALVIGEEVSSSSDDSLPPPDESPPEFTDSSTEESTSSSDSERAVRKKSRRSSSKKKKTNLRRKKEKLKIDQKVMEGYLYRRETGGKFFGKRKAKWRKLYCVFDGQSFVAFTDSDKAKHAANFILGPANTVTVFSKNLYATEHNRDGYPFSIKQGDSDKTMMWEAESAKIRSRWLRAFSFVTTVEGLTGPEEGSASGGDGYFTAGGLGTGVTPGIVGGVIREEKLKDKFILEIYLTLKMEPKKNRPGKRRFCVMTFELNEQKQVTLQFYDDERRTRQREIIQLSGGQDKIFGIDDSHPDADSLPGAMLLYPNQYEDLYYVLTAGSDEAREDLLDRLSGYLNVEHPKDRAGDGTEEPESVSSVAESNRSLSSLAGLPKNLHEVFLQMSAAWPTSFTNSLASRSKALQQQQQKKDSSSSSSSSSSEDFTAEVQRMKALHELVVEWGNTRAAKCTCGAGVPCPLRMAHVFLSQGGRQVLSRLLQLCLGHNRHYWSPPRQDAEEEGSRKPSKPRRSKPLSGLGFLDTLPGTAEERAYVLGMVLRVLGSLFDLARQSRISQCVSLNLVRAELPAGNYEVIRAQSKQSKDQVNFIINVQLGDAGDASKRWTVAKPLEELRTEYQQLEEILTGTPEGEAIALKPFPPPLSGASESALNARRAALHTAFSHLTSEEILPKVLQVRAARNQLLRILGVRRYDNKDHLHRTFLEAVMAISDELGPTRQVSSVIIDEVLSLYLGFSVNLMGEQSETFSREGAEDSVGCEKVLRHFFMLLAGAPLPVLCKALEKFTHALMKTPENCRFIYNESNWQEWFAPLIVETYTAAQEQQQQQQQQASSTSNTSLTLDSQTRQTDLPSTVELKAQAYRLAMHLFIYIHHFYLTTNEEDVRERRAERVVSTMLRSSISAMGQYETHPVYAGLVGGQLRDRGGKIVDDDTFSSQASTWREAEEEEKTKSGSASSSSSSSAVEVPGAPFRTLQLLGEDPFDGRTRVGMEDGLIFVRLGLPMGIHTRAGPTGWGVRIESLDEGAASHYNQAAARAKSSHLPIERGASILALRTASGVIVNLYNKRYKVALNLLRWACQPHPNNTIILVVGHVDDAMPLPASKWFRVLNRPPQQEFPGGGVPGSPSVGSFSLSSRPGSPGLDPVHSRTMSFSGLPGPLDLGSPRRSRTLTRSSFAQFVEESADGRCSRLWGEEKVWIGGRPHQAWSRRNIEVCRAVLTGIINKLHSTVGQFRLKHDWLHWDGTMQVLETCQRLLWYQLPFETHQTVCLADSDDEAEEDPEDGPSSSSARGSRAPRSESLKEDGPPGRRGTMLERAASAGGLLRKQSMLRARSKSSLADLHAATGPLGGVGGGGGGGPPSVPGSPALTGQQELEGYLNKRGAKRKSWKRRFFTLRKDQLSWFENEKAYRRNKNPLGRINVFGARVVSYLENVWSDENRKGKCFSVAEAQGKRRLLVLEADDPSGMFPWLNAFITNGAIDGGPVSSKKEAVDPSASSPSSSKSGGMSGIDALAFADSLAGGETGGQPQEEEIYEIETSELEDAEDPRGLVILNYPILEKIHSLIRALKIFDIDTAEDVMIGQNADDRKRISDHRKFGLHYMDFFREIAKSWMLFESKQHHGQPPPTFPLLTHTGAARKPSTAAAGRHLSQEDLWSVRPDMVSWCLARAIRLKVGMHVDPVFSDKEVFNEAKLQRKREEVHDIRLQSQLPVVYDSDSDNGAEHPQLPLHAMAAGLSLADLEEAREKQMVQDIRDDLHSEIAAWRIPTSGNQAERCTLFIRRRASGGSSDQEESRSSVRSKLSSRSVDGPVSLSSPSGEGEFLDIASSVSRSGGGGGGGAGVEEEDHLEEGGSSEYVLVWKVGHKEAGRIVLNADVRILPYYKGGVFRTKDSQWLSRLTGSGGPALEIAGRLSIGLRTDGKRGQDFVLLSPADHHILLRTLLRICNQARVRRKRRRELEEQRARAQRLKEEQQARRRAARGGGPQNSSSSSEMDLSGDEDMAAALRPHTALYRSVFGGGAGDGSSGAAGKRRKSRGKKRRPNKRIGYLGTRHRNGSGKWSQRYGAVSGNLFRVYPDWTDYQKNPNKAQKSFSLEAARVAPIHHRTFRDEKREGVWFGVSAVRAESGASAAAAAAAGPEFLILETTDSKERQDWMDALVAGGAVLMPQIRKKDGSDLGELPPDPNTSTSGGPGGDADGSEVVVSPPVIEGVLRKRAVGDLETRKHWKPCYVLFDGTYISIFDTKEDYEADKERGGVGEARLSFSVKKARVVSFTGRVWADEGCQGKTMAIKVRGARPSHALFLEAKDDKERYDWMEALSQHGADDGGLVDSRQGVVAPGEKIRTRKRRKASTLDGSGGAGGTAKLIHSGTLPTRRKNGKWKTRFYRLYGNGVLRQWDKEESADAGEEPRSEFHGGESQVVSFRRQVWSDERKNPTKSFAVFPRNASNLEEAKSSLIATLSSSDTYNWLKALLKAGFQDAGVSSDKKAKELEPRKSRKDRSSSASSSRKPKSSRRKSKRKEEESRKERRSSKAERRSSASADAGKDSSRSSRRKGSRRPSSKAAAASAKSKNASAEAAAAEEEAPPSSSSTTSSESESSTDTAPSAPSGSESSSSASSSSSSSSSGSEDSDDLPPPDRSRRGRATILGVLSNRTPPTVPEESEEEEEEEEEDDSSSSDDGSSSGASDSGSSDDTDDIVPPPKKPLTRSPSSSPSLTARNSRQKAMSVLETSSDSDD